MERAANKAAALATFKDYRGRKAANTIRRQDTDLDLFAHYLESIRVPMADFANDPGAWRGITWGIVEGFVKWQLLNGYAVDSVNVRLSTVKTYAQLALKAGALDISDYSMIRTVKAYSQNEKKRIDEGCFHLEMALIRLGHTKGGEPWPSIFATDIFSNSWISTRKK